MKTMRTAEIAARDAARGYTDEDLAEVSDNPPLTREEIAGMRPFREVFPEFYEVWKRSRGKQKAPTKVAVSLRLSREVVEHYRATGPGWQARIDADLRARIGKA